MAPCAANTWFSAASDCSSETECCTTAGCEAGKYCIHGMKISCPYGFICPNPRSATTEIFDACPKGTYRKALAGSVAATDCAKCDAGYGCVEEGANDKYTQCGAGYYCYS